METMDKFSSNAEISRRTLLRLAGATGVAFGVSSLLTACGSSSTSNDQSAVTVAVPADPPTLDPVFQNDATVVLIYWLVNERLYEYEKDAAIKPMLAAAMPTVSSDGLTYTIKLVDDAKFTNGKKLDSGDVKFTYELMMDVKNASKWLSYVAHIKSVEAPDPRTVVVTLREPYLYILDSMATLPIVPSNVPYNPKTYAEKLIGTGPFKLQRWQHGQQIELVKNPDFRVKGQPGLEKVTFTTTPDETARIASLVSGDVQIVPNITSTASKTVKSRGGQVYTAQGSNTTYMMWPNWKKGHATADQNMRLAIAWAIDRQRISTQIFNGLAKPESTVPSRGTAYYDETAGSFFGSQPDLVKARRYLAAAGGPPSEALKILTVTTDAQNAAVTTIVQENLKSIGISSTVQPISPSALPDAFSAASYDLITFNILAILPPTQGNFLYKIGSTQNFNGVNDPTLSTLATKLVSFTKRGPEAEMSVRALQQRASEVVPLICMVNIPAIFGLAKNLHGFNVYKGSDFSSLKTTKLS